MARGGSWWLVVVVVINVLARGGLWWLVVACGGWCVVLEMTPVHKRLSGKVLKEDKTFEIFCYYSAFAE